MIQTALTIAGLDPSGGAGIAADLRAFRSCKVWGASVCTVLTVQSTQGISELHPVDAPLVLHQAKSIFTDMNVRAVKIGAVGSVDNIHIICELIHQYPHISFVLDPVMIPSQLLQPHLRLDGPNAIQEMRLLATSVDLVTPNLPEALSLLNESNHKSRKQLSNVSIAQKILAHGIKRVLVKDGHNTAEKVTDVFASTTQMKSFTLPRLRSRKPFHGTGCLLSSLIVGKISQRKAHTKPTDQDWIEAIAWAKKQLMKAFLKPIRAGKGMYVLDPIL